MDIVGDETESMAEDEEWALGMGETPRQRAPKQGSLGFSVVGFLSGPGEQAQLGVFISDIVPGGVAHRSPSLCVFPHVLPLHCTALQIQLLLQAFARPGPNTRHLHLISLPLLYEC